MGLERLQIFVRFCNFCGLIPFRMVLDDETKKFKRFESRWINPTYLWFLLFLIGHIFFSIIFSYISYSWALQVMQTETIASVAVIMLYFFSTLSIVSTPRLFLLRFRRLEEALDNLHRIDRTLNKITDYIPCNTRRRTLIGIGFCFCGVNNRFNTNIKLANF